MKSYEAFRMREDDVREYLAELIEALDNLDQEDYFGTEGWRRMLMGED